MSTSKVRARPGDVYSIPLSSTQTALVKVVYASGHFRNVLGVAVAQDLAPVAGVLRPNSFGRALFYTAQACAKTGWLYQYSETVTESETARTLRVVADHVYLGDDIVRHASPSDLECLPQMDVYGCAGLLNALRRLFTLPGPVAS